MVCCASLDTLEFEAALLLEVDGAADGELHPPANSVQTTAKPIRLLRTLIAIALLDRLQIHSNYTIYTILCKNGRYM